MILKNIFTTQFNNYRFSSYGLSIKDGTSLLSMIHYFLSDDYDFFFTNNQLDLTEILTGAHEVYFDSTTIGCIIKTKTVYIMNTHEIDEYFYENDLTPLELFEQNLISAALIPLDNFTELINDWHQLNLQKVPFALLYQDEQDWIACKGFETQEAMEAFVKQHSDGTKLPT